MSLIKYTKKYKKEMLERIGESSYIPLSKAQSELMKADFQNIREVTMGGAAEGGKTTALLISSLGPQKDNKGSFSMLVDNPSYRGLIFRREAAQLEKTSLINSAREWYQKLFPKVEYNGSLRRFTFPSGATITFAGCESESDTLKYKGFTKLHFVGFEELTQFTATQYEFLSTRLRDLDGGIPLRVRATTNPGDVHEDWVLERYKYWLHGHTFQPIETPIKAKFAQPLWMYADEDKPDRPIVVTDKITDNLKEIAQKFLFIQTFAGDILDNSVQNMAKISDPVLKMQLLDGIWGLKNGAGLYFKESDFQLAEDKPLYSTKVRYWDMACSGPKGDYLAGALVSHYIERGESKFCIEDLYLKKVEAAQLEREILCQAKIDGKGVFIGIEQEGASAGKIMADIWKDKLIGYRVKIDQKKGMSKTARASLVSPLSALGKISFIPNSNSNEMFRQLVNFPTKGVHDDAVDSITGAIFLLTEELPKPLTGPVYPRKVDRKDVYQRLEELRTTPSMFLQRQ